MMFKLSEAFSSISSYSQTSTAANQRLSRTLQSSKSFSRLEPLKNTLTRNRASTIQNIPQAPSAKEIESNEGLFDRDIIKEGSDDELDVNSQKSSTLPDDF